MQTRVCSLVFLLSGPFVVIAAGQGEAEDAVPVPAQAVESPADAAAKSVLQVPPELLRGLSHETYKERLAAQDSLLEWGMKDLGGSIEMLYGWYRRSDDPEVRLRSRAVLKRLIIVQQPFDGEGYLGIQMEPAQWKNGLGELQPAVRITVVREGTAAEVAKLKVDDMVTGVDHIVFDDLAPTRMFADYIQSKGPGDTITLHLQRGEKALKIKTSLRRRSPLLDRLTQWGTQLQLPDQAELDESDFRDWLKLQAAAERARSKGDK